MGFRVSIPDEILSLDVSLQTVYLACQSLSPSSVKAANIILQNSIVMCENAHSKTISDFSKSLKLIQRMLSKIQNIGDSTQQMITMSKDPVFSTNWKE